MWRITMGLAATSLLASMTVLPASAAVPPAGLAAHGPIDSANGYPYWYSDHGLPAAGINPVRLELCLETAECPMAPSPPDPSQPVSFPDNYADEGFWFAAEASIDRPVGNRALLVLAQEAAFGNTGAVAVGQQTGFARQRIRIDGLVTGQTYTVTNPYGVDSFVAVDDGKGGGEINDTVDIGCLSAPCTWDESFDGKVGPFLRWDPAVAPAAPAGFIGDGTTGHAVVGSPNGTNVFRIEGPSVGGPGVNVVETNQFVVQGRIAQLRAGVSPRGDLYAAPLRATIQASFPAEAKIVYTTDGTDPAVTAGGTVNGTVYSPAAGDTAAAAVVEIGSGQTVLKYIAVDLATGQSTPVYTETYQVAGGLPAVSASPDGSAVLNGAQTVTLTATDPAAAPGTPAPAIYYTVDGTAPRVLAGLPQGTAMAYIGPLNISGSTTVKALAVGAAGTVGAVSTFGFTIHNLAAAGPVSTQNGFPEWYEDLNGQRLDLCLNDANCPLGVPNEAAPVSFPGNFPDEAFWWSADAGLDVPGGGSARLVLAAEATFVNGTAVAGDQLAFGRTRYTMRGLVGGASYRITQPYGVATLTAEPDGAIFSTSDVGCLNAPCDFTGIFESGIGPFLRSTAAPAGYLGDGATEGPVTGSPFGTNLFRLEQLTDASGAGLPAPVLVGETNQFVVVGRLAAGGTTPPGTAPAAPTAAPAGGSYNTAQNVTLSTATAGAQIHYTTNGSAPTAASPAYTVGTAVPITAQGTTTLKAIAVAGGVASAVTTEVYTVDTEAPTVAATPAGGSFAGAVSVSLQSNDTNARIHYTTDGSVPTISSPGYTAPLTVSQSLTLRAVAVDLAGNITNVPASWNFQISRPASSIGLSTGSSEVPTGGSAVLTGTLQAAGAMAGRQVAVEARETGAAGYTRVGTSTVQTNGSFSYGVTPRMNTDYRATFAGDGAASGSASTAVRVSVKPKVVIDRIIPAQVRRGKDLLIGGTIGSVPPGSTVTVTIVGERGRTITATGTTDANGRWQVTMRAPGKEGNYPVTARWAGSAQYLGSASAPGTVRVIK